MLSKEELIQEKEYFGLSDLEMSGHRIYRGERCVSGKVGLQFKGLSGMYRNRGGRAYWFFPAGIDIVDTILSIGTNKQIREHNYEGIKIKSKSMAKLFDDIYRQTNSFWEQYMKKKKEDDKFTDEQSEEELQGIIDMYKTSSPDSEHEKDMLQSILTLNDTTVEEVFTHRKNIYSIDSSLEINEIIKKINNSRFTRIPFWKNNPENIIGLLNIRTLNIDLSKKESSKEIIFDKISKPWFIPETTNLLEQLAAFKNRKEHIAFVVDEYGELLGLITLEDIIEEIVGEIVDEIDLGNEQFTKIDDGTIITNGENNLKDLYKYFDLDAPSSEASTISGQILEIAKRIPLFGEEVKDDYFSYKVLSHSRKQISKIEVKIIK